MVAKSFSRRCIGAGPNAFTPPTAALFTPDTTHRVYASDSIDTQLLWMEGTCVFVCSVTVTLTDGVFVHIELPSSDTVGGLRKLVVDRLLWCVFEENLAVATEEQYELVLVA